VDNGFAERCSARVDDSVGLDPITIITIITSLLPVLIGSFQRTDEPSPEQAKEFIRRSHERNPRKLLRRTTAAVRRKSETRLNHTQAEEIAEAIIEQALAEDEETIALAFAAVEPV
jgi:hypothetical protein